MTRLNLILILSLLLSINVKAEFKDAKTFFQVTVNYDDRINIPVDAVVVHSPGDLQTCYNSWIQSFNVPMGRMFFADSDNLNEYWTGQWDGIDHTQDTEIAADGTTFMCCGFRPYMTATQLWGDYLIAEKLLPSIINYGVDVIMPEEPLAHIHSGYEQSFKDAYQEYYKIPWQAENSSDIALYRTGELKAILYRNLEVKLLHATKDSNSEVNFIVPIHSMYSNIAAGFTVPLGLTLDIDGLEGYVGQIWTGPVNWALNSYGSSDKSFFSSAYNLYNYFVQLTVGTDKKLWLFIDPVEDDPNHTWEEFVQWYQHCAAAMLFMKDINSYEVMPWPGRIFLPGYDAGGGTPAPVSFRTRILAITQVLQDMPLGGTWINGSEDHGIGIAIADSAMWQKRNYSVLNGLYGMAIPLLQRGIPVSNCVLERSNDAEYMSRFKLIVVSFEEFKPYKKSMVVNLAKWVNKGGLLVVLSANIDALDADSSFWWSQDGYASPKEALLDIFKKKSCYKGTFRFGKGSVSINEISPRTFTSASVVESNYLPILKKMLKKIGVNDLISPNGFCMSRGDYVIVHATSGTIQLDGTYIDIFSDDLVVVDSPVITAGNSGLYRNITNELNGSEPKLLQSTYRVLSQEYTSRDYNITTRGPKDCQGYIKLYLGDKSILSITVTGNGQSLPHTYTVADNILSIEYSYSETGTTRIRLIFNE